jgi:hypothetical protein
MADPKVMNGSRALVYVGSKLVGVFNSINWNVSYDSGDAWILGRTTPAEIEYLAQEPVTGSMSGWRTIKGGPHVVGLPSLQNLLTSDYTQIVVVDRITGERVGIMQKVRLTGQGGGVSARQMSEMSIPYKAIFFSDESQQNVEAKGAPDLTIA